jgi:HD-GYP domain-containing protein (c-di-GMP phosphodiesterase class II)
MDTTNEQLAFRFTDNEQIDRMLNRIVSEVKGFTETQLGHIMRLAQIGASLSAERNLDRILEMIVDEARRYTSANGGTLYIMSDDAAELTFAIVQNETLHLRMGGAGDTITWAPVPLYNPDGSPNHANVSAYAALSGDVVNIPDVYDAAGFNFEGTRKFDAQTGYRSRSMLVVPLRDHENDIIGVLQLLNAQDTPTGEVITFSPESRRMTESLASQAAVAITNHRLIDNLQNLLESFIATIAAAIDAKSPYTGGHVRRVAGLTMMIARAVNETREGALAAVRFTEDELQELHMAALLHDVGKITTPENIIDKATKLETIYDRIGLLRARFDILKRDRRIASCARDREVPPSREEGDASRCGDGGATTSEDAAEAALEEDFAFLERVNRGHEFLTDGMIERLREIAGRTWCRGSEAAPLIAPDELRNLCIRRGTLNDEERNIVNNHAAVTSAMLSPLPFPKKLRRVARYAAAHHEKLDGTGYPFGLQGDELPLQARILALADIFEALTAKDRPYKKGRTLAEVMEVLSDMVKDRHVDPDLFALFVRERIHLVYARRELPDHGEEGDFLP